MISIKKLISILDGDQVAITAVWKEVLKQGGGPKTFAEWEKIRYSELPEEIRKQAASEMLKLATTYSGFDTVRGMVDSKSPQYATAMKGMVTHAKTVGEWLIIYKLSQRDSDLERRAIREIAKFLAKSSS